MERGVGSSEKVEVKGATLQIIPVSTIDSKDIGHMMETV